MNTSTERDVSIIIPTFCEVKNIVALVTRFAQLDLGDRQFEVILVDDNSQDGIVEIVKELAAQHAWLKILVRQGPRSLSLAVIEGFQRAMYPLLICMDADLSHPPEKVPELLAALAAPETEFVIGSRYMPGGSTDELWPFYRKFSSRFAAYLANLFIFSSSRTTDPLSGFFALRRKTFLAGSALQATSWKIGLEMMVKYRCKIIKEVPIHFAERHQGKSKFSAKVVINYLWHLKDLLWFRLSQSIIRKLNQQNS